MGKLELTSRKRAKKKNVRKAILKSIALAGTLSVALVAPNAIAVLAKAGVLPTQQERSSIARTRARLVRQGLLSYQRGLLHLTQKGKETLVHLEVLEYKIAKPKRWDGRWRVLIFDIPEHRRATRDQIRITLTRVGFIRLQDSVWLYPYDCEDLIMLLKADFAIGKDLLYLIVDTLENDKPFKDFFSLR